MKKFMCIFFIIVFSIFIGIYIYKINNNNLDIKVPIKPDISKIDTELELLETNFSIVKTTPNTILVFKKYFLDCNHTVIEENYISEILVNKSEDDFKNLFSDWILESFSENEVVLLKNFNGFCNEHYLLKDENGIIVIYSLDENDLEVLEEITEISTEYLTETDKMNLKNGITVYGKANLYSALEDFE